MASIDDKISKVSNGTRPVSTTVTSSRSSGVTTLACADLTGWTTDTKVDFVTYEIDGQGNVVAGTQTDWKGVVSGSNINNLTATGGADNGNSVGDIVEILPTAQYAKDLADALLTSLDQDGTLKAGAVDNSAALADGVVSAAKVASGAITNVKLSTATGELGGAWQSWTPTLTGFSGTPTVTARYTQRGKTVHVFITVGGTSNATTKFFTLPVTANSVNDEFLGLGSNSDNGANYLGAAVYRPATPNVQVYRGLAGGTGSQFSSWTASGTVGFTLRFTYEAS